MNGSYGNTSFVVRLRGLPWNTTQTEVQNFLQGCNVRQTNFVTNDQGRATGECFVVLESNEDVDNAKSFHQKNIGSRYIEVFESNADEMTQTTKNNTTATTNNNNNNNNNNNANSNLNTTNQNSENNSSNTDNWREPVIRLRGLPYNSSKEDVTRFFDGLDIAQNGVHISSSKPAGEAFVAFVNMDNALRALEFNRMNMGHRYIEVFKSTYAEARASIMNDTQSMARQRGSGPNQNYGNQRQGNYGGYSGNMGGNSGFNNNMNQFDGPPQDNYNFSGADDAGNNFPMNNQMGSGTGVKRPMTVSFTMKIRGVPFEAGEKEVFEFFSPVVPIRLEQENTPRGKPPIWYAEFGSREEATEALTYHKKYMGTRYIELLPLYDDVNRSKMVRT
ncbi:unnamed protein product [Rotaria magnacalcarata]|uniref:RRM domain-containing protein n=1 Tax=Rotaria magnacalcarata TaxID=392030 RepID=A0A814XCB9_9BILA|nr:unnamed protein product [Rotaria magnacalcarata]CAF1472649.1 unnamed protein product [Rotaria magnacalcarata]CAF1918823.1 unnamed protein product [Rotaria magnacalcarata]